MGFGSRNPNVRVSYGGYSFPGIGDIFGPNPPRGIPIGTPISGPGAGVPATTPSSAVAGILASIASFLGKRAVTLNQVVAIIRRLAKFLSPVAVAAAIGITAFDLGDLLTAHSLKKRRRMNPLNFKALSRAQRRLCSFENKAKKVYTFNRSSGFRKPRKRKC